MNVRDAIWQRASAAVMAPMVIVHLAVMVYATRKGLTAADILARTRGSYVWFAFYSAFAVTAAVHAEIGLRTILLEWTRWPERGVQAACVALALAIATLGSRAAYAVTFG